MGAGAGYNIEFDIQADGNFTDVANQITSIEYRDGMMYIDGRIECIGRVSGYSYYYGSGWIDNVGIVATHIEMSVDYEPDLLTKDCIRRIESQFGGEFGDTIQYIDFNKYGETLTIADFNMDEVTYAIWSYLSIKELSKTLGGGWTHSTFTGVAEVETNDLYKVVLEIPDGGVVDYLDTAIRGDNQSFEVVFDGGQGDVYDTLSEAIDALKSEIDNAPDIEAIDLDDCYVDSMYYLMTSADPEEFDYDIDNSYIEYRASEDPDYQEYI